MAKTESVHCAVCVRLRLVLSRGVSVVDAREKDATQPRGALACGVQCADFEEGLRCTNCSISNKHTVSFTVRQHSLRERCRTWDAILGSRPAQDRWKVPLHSQTVEVGMNGRPRLIVLEVSIPILETGSASQNPRTGVGCLLRGVPALEWPFSGVASPYSTFSVRFVVVVGRDKGHYRQQPLGVSWAPSVVPRLRFNIYGRLT